MAGALPPLGDQPIIDASGRPSYSMVQWMQSLAAQVGGTTGGSSGGSGGSTTLYEQVQNLTTTVAQALTLTGSVDPTLPGQLQAILDALSRLQIRLDAAPGRREEVMPPLYLPPVTAPGVPAFVPPPDGIMHLLNGGRVLDGWGAPNGTVYGSVGDEYLQLDGTTGAGPQWIKNSGTNTNTGWGQPAGVAGVSTVVAGTGLAGGTITGTGTISLGTIAAGELFGNAGTVAGIPTGVTLGAGLTLSPDGTISATGTTGVTDVVVAGSAFLNAGTITNTGTISSPNLAAQSLIGNGATTAAAAGVIAIGANLTLSSTGTLSATAGGGGSTTIVAGSGLTGGTITASGTIALEPSQSIRSVPFPMVGPGTLVGGQDMLITIGQAGTLLANSGYAHIKSNPTATETLTFNTINNGTVVTHGTISVSTAGATTFPTFANVPWSAGDSVELINQATADVSFSTACIGFLFQVT